MQQRPHERLTPISLAQVIDLHQLKAPSKG
jgi:hypothetical protein